MLKKISVMIFLILMIMVITLSNLLTNVQNIMIKLSLNMCVEYNGIKLCISYFYFPIIITLLERVFKIHDKLSDLFYIRYNFDTKIIIYTMFDKFNMTNKFIKVNKSNRKEIMNNIFYKYASSTKPLIDTHLIYMALDMWCWYWITLDSICLFIAFSSLLLITKFKIKWCIVLIIILLALFLLLFGIKKQCKKYALRQVDEIYNDSKYRKDIKGYLHALCN